MSSVGVSVATIGIFGMTTALVMIRPFAAAEAVWTCAGAGVMLALGLVKLGDVADVLLAARDPLLFLLALLLLAALVERSAFFEWAAIRAARAARGDSRVLFRNVFVLGAAVTALLSLDTTAVILTPLVLAFVARLRLPPRPYVLACAFVANAASLPLPISNLTNLLFAATFHFSFAAFFVRMALPQLVALVATYGLLGWSCRRQLGDRFDVERLPEAASVVGHRPYFRAATFALAFVGVGYFAAPLAGLEPYVPAFAAALVLAVYGRAVGRVSFGALAREGGWSVFPFVVGLFVVVRGVEKLGVADWAAAAMHGFASRPAIALPVVVAAATAGSNLLNNLPAALLARTILESVRAPTVVVYGALLGTNIGPNVVTFGSLATLLVLGRARDRGVDVSGADFLRVGLCVTPGVLVAATVALALVARAFGR